MSNPETSNKRIILFAVIVFIMAGAGIGWAAIPQNTIRHNAGIVMPTVNATAGYWVGANEVISTARAFTGISYIIGANTLDTTEWGFLDGTNQALSTADSVTFDEITGQAFTIGLDTLDTTEWAFLNGTDQSISSTSSVAFLDVNADEYFLSSVNKTDIMKYPQQDYSYLVWVDNSTGTPDYFAKNGTTGAIDYSGTNFAAVVQDSSDVLSNGGLIFFREGLFHLSQSITPKDNIEYLGSGQGTIFKIIANQTNVFNASSGNNITFRNFAIDCSYSTLTYVNHDLSGFWIDSDWGTTKTSVNNIIIDTIKIDDCFVGVFLRGTNNIVTNCIMKDVNGAGVEFAGDYNTITGCYIKTITTIGAAVHCVELLGGLNVNYNIISNNILFGGDGIYFQGSSAATLVTGNFIQSSVNGRFPIRTTTGIASVTFTGNIFGGWSHTQTCEIDINRAVFTGNSFSTNYKIRLDGDDCYVSSNSFYLSSSIIDNGAGNRITDNLGFITENNGLGTLYNLTSSVTIAHGLQLTPTAQDITITFTSSLANVTQWWVSGVDGTNFVLNVGDAGVARLTSTDITFGWSVNRQ